MLLSVDKINSFYGYSHILHDVSFLVDSSEMMALLGRNGVGKSTTLKSIIGIVPPRNGSILFKNKAIGGLPPYRISRMGIGYVPEDRRVFPKLTVRENLLIGQHSKSRREKIGEWHIERAYSQFPLLRDRDKTLAGNLSGGEQQMLTLVRTLLGNPELLLIDEPSEGLSPMLVEVIFDLISEIKNSGVSIILVDQNLSLACSGASRAYIMTKGRIVHSGSGEEVLADRELQKKYFAV